MSTKINNRPRRCVKCGDDDATREHGTRFFLKGGLAVCDLHAPAAMRRKVEWETGTSLAEVAS